MTHGTFSIRQNDFRSAATENKADRGGQELKILGNPAEIAQQKMVLRREFSEGRAKAAQKTPEVTIPEELARYESSSKPPYGGGQATLGNH
jgi:hypothetical protein